MKKILRVELKKALSGTPFKISLFISCALVAWHLIYLYGLMQQHYLEAVPGRFTGKYNLFYWWLPIDCISAPYAVFYNLFPLLSCIPYAWSFMSERGTEYTYQMYCRCGAEKYIFSKYIAVLLSGGLVIAVPLVIDLMCAALFSPATIPTITFAMPGFHKGYFLSEVYYSHPWIFCFAFLGLDFLWGGSIAALSFVFTQSFRAKVFGVVLPMVAVFVWDILSVYPKSVYQSITGKIVEFSVLKLLHGNPIDPNPAWVQLSTIAVMILISSASAYALAMRKDKL